MNIRNFRYEKDHFLKNAQGISKNYHGVLLLMKILQTKPQIKNMDIIFCTLYYTVIKNRDEKETVNGKKENIENDYINFIDSINPNHYVGIENNRQKLK